MNYLENLDFIKFTNGAIIEIINAIECLFPKSFLMIRKKKSSEFLSLKEIFTMILCFGHS